MAAIRLSYRTAREPESTSHALLWASLCSPLQTEALTLAVKTGKAHILKAIETHYKTSPLYESIVIPTSIARFQRLADRKEKYEGTISEARVKELTSPILMVLLKRPDLLERTLLVYLEVCSEARAYFNSKLDQLLKGVIKEPSQVTQLSDFIFRQYAQRPAESRLLALIYRLIGVVKHRAKYYKAFIESFRRFYKDHMADFFRLVGNLEPKVLVDTFIAFFEGEESYESLNLEQAFSQWAINTEEFVFHLAFSDRQHRKFQLCADLLDNVLQAHGARMALQPLFSRIMAAYKEREAKELPLMVVYTGLAFAGWDKRERNGIDGYLEVFKEGIARGMCTDPQFWQFLLRFCLMDRVIAEERVASLLPENLQIDFFDQYRKLRS